LAPPRADRGMSAADRHARIKDVFLAVRDLPEGEREAAVERACAGDDGLRGEVRSLLALDRTGDVLAPPPSSGVVEAREAGGAGGDPLGLVGATLDGRYRVEALTSEGGFGYVYRAEQVLWRRRVAGK